MYNPWSAMADMFIPVKDRNIIDVSNMAVEVVMQMLSNHPCPACGGKTYLQDGDAFGCVRVYCQHHGMFSLQRAS